MFKGLGTVCSVAALLAAFGTTQAYASAPDAAAPVMPMGARMAGPSGLFAFCTRDPETCLNTRAETSEDLEALRSEARQTFWRAAFGLEATPAAAPAAVDAPATRDWSRLVPRARREEKVPNRASGDAPVAMAAAAVDEGAPSVEDSASSAVAVDAGEADGLVALAAADVEPAPSPDPVAAALLAEVVIGPMTPASETFVFDRAGWALVNRVNRTINRDVRRVTDTRLYGVADYWAAPSGPSAQGDCEDFVLAKRQALIEAGVPASVLSIALVETAWGEAHAVLLVAGDRGEFVLDNLSPWVSRWDRVNYRWRSRQAGPSLFDWVRLDL